MNATADNPGFHADDVGGGMQALLKTLRVLFFLLRVLMIVIAVYLVFSGVFYVREHEEAMLFRFGELREVDGREVLTSGRWYWAWPFPIERVERIPAQSSISLSTETTFLPEENPNMLETGVPPRDESADPLRPGIDGYLLTGDANIVHMKWTITYRVTDPKKYYLDFFHESEKDDASRGDAALEAEENEDGNGEEDRHRAESSGERDPGGVTEIIRTVLANAALTEVAAWSIEDVLKRSRKDSAEATTSLDDAVSARARSMLSDLGLGIEVQQIGLAGIQPPVGTHWAFMEVAEAAQDYEMQINEAQAYEKSVVPKAEGDASEIITEAKAYKTRTVESIKAEKSYFETVLKEYEKNPETMLVALYTDAIREVLNNVETKYIVHTKADGSQEIRLLLGPEPEKPGTVEEEEK